MSEQSRRKVNSSIAGDQSLRRVVVMISVSMIKIVASSVVLAACGSALVLGVAHVQDLWRPAADAPTATTSAPQAAQAARDDAPRAAIETPPALAAAQASTALAALGAGKDQSSPSFDVVRVDADGSAVVAGRAAPGATVDLLRGSERLDRAVADASGEFAMVPSGLPAGSYELTLSAKLSDGTVALSKKGVAVTVNDAGPSAHAAQSRAEYIPETGSQPRPSSEPGSSSGKPQETTAPKQARAVAASSAPDESSSSPAVAHAISSRVKIVSHGDSLWRISHFTYGDGARYALLYRANRDRIRNPNLIYPGQTLLLPTKRN